MLPPIPAWDGLHPLVIHFPIALLIIAPMLILIGIFSKNKGRTFLISAFILMLIGTIGAFVAVSTGEAAGELAERLPGVDAVLEEHEELAETTRTVFTALTAIFGVLVFAPMLFGRKNKTVMMTRAGDTYIPESVEPAGLSHKIMIPLGLAFLLFYSAGILLLLNTAHQGGRLVHEFGVRAFMPQTAQTGTVNKNSAESKKSKHDDDDDDKD